MPKYTRRGKANQPEAGHGNPALLIPDEPTVSIPCGMRHVASVEIELFHTDDSQLWDRRVTITLDCGHVKNVSMSLTALVPDVGDPSRCLRIACRGADEW